MQVQMAGCRRSAAAEVGTGGVRLIEVGVLKVMFDRPLSMCEECMREEAGARRAYATVLSPNVGYFTYERL